MAADYIRPSELPSEDRDRQFGAFMAAWGELELGLMELTWNLLGLDYQAARAVFANCSGIAQLRDLIHALAQLRLTASEQTALAGVSSRLKRLATKRNRIVHGAWVAHLDDSEDLVFVEWVRHYHPADNAITTSALRGDDQKIAAAFTFRLPQISRAAKDALALRDEVALLSRRIGERLYDGPPPIGFAPQRHAAQNAALTG